ncbi:DegT/DnrJ/EryC1/StrS aminotransferase family protein [Acidipila sp. EB88]|uniref:DegT/DnrJ/EryC1/StrS family aminotransferase n=1 Tax=Acidipila sp. EB88 TaxID=2305226 RepID=UPI000F5DC1CD|nr:DegT/DnrJ/EryC1/StrS family aminotransferase [Acidipila sp. EB88]RRA47271.1 DegT/DnrJ/EryC1/StrS family aminotransferase [Acidipila sp. EB88]
MSEQKPAPLPFIDLQAQYRELKHSIDTRIHAVLDHGQYILGPEVKQLEERLAARVGVKHCISCSSGTDALLMALMALGVGPGDEVITSPFTFFATGEMIALLGAVPVMVDIEPDTYNIDPKLIEAAITARTRAIMPVALYGQPAEMDAINEIAARHKLPVIEDAAQSFGAMYKGRHSCALSTIGCTSFFPSKPLGGYGDGGACFTDDDALAVKMHQLRNHGQEARYRHSEIGINGRLDTLQAAILLAKLDVFDRELIARGEVANAYNGTLLALQKTGKLLRIPELRAGRTSPYAQYTVEVEHRDAVIAAMSEAGVPTAVHYPVPMHQQPVFVRSEAGERAAGTLPNAEHAAAHVLSLPLHPYLGRRSMQRVTRALEEAVVKAAAEAPGVPVLVETGKA